MDYSPVENLNSDTIFFTSLAGHQNNHESLKNYVCIRITLDFFSEAS